MHPNPIFRLVYTDTSINISLTLFVQSLYKSACAGLNIHAVQTGIRNQLHVCRTNRCDPIASRTSIPQLMVVDGQWRSGPMKKSFRRCRQRFDGYTHTAMLNSDPCVPEVCFQIPLRPYRATRFNLLLISALAVGARLSGPPE